MIDETVEVLTNDEVAEDFFLARLEAPHIAAHAQPGQFVNVEVNAGVAPFLRMPLSVCAVHRQINCIDVLYQNMGLKSGELSRCRVGEQLRCLGPLGKAFSPVSPPMRSVLVGGGIGVPPMIFLGSELIKKGVEVALLVGARSAAKHLADSFFQGAATRLGRATDDGSLGHHGLVTELLQRELAAGPCAVYTCGPHAMIEAVARACVERDVPCQVSLEEYMACGIGICVGCVVRVENADANNAYADYKRICVDGPVFDAREIRWEH